MVPSLMPQSPLVFCSFATYDLTCSPPSERLEQAILEGFKESFSGKREFVPRDQVFIINMSFIVHYNYYTRKSVDLHGQEPIYTSFTHKNYFELFSSSYFLLTISQLTSDICRLP